MRKPNYCVQNGGDCPSCSLANYGRDCMNNRFFNLAQVAEFIAFGNQKAMAIILNDCGADPIFNELQPDSMAFVPRPVLVDLAALRAGDRVGRKAAELIEK